MKNIGFVIYADKNLDNAIEIANKLQDYTVVIANDRNGSDAKIKGKTLIYRDKQSYAACVNDGLRHLTQDGCEHLFILRDNIVINDLNFIQPYIDTFLATGVHILFNNFDNTTMFDYSTLSVKLNDRFYKHLIYINKQCIKQIGYLDEKYKDSFEVLDYYYRLYNKGLCGPVGYFVSPNTPMVEEIKLENAVDINEDILLRGLKLFKHKYNYTPVELPILNMNEASQVFQKLFTRFVK